MLWQPVLSGKDRDSALGLAHEILDALLGFQPEDASLAAGSAGLAVAFAYGWLVFDDTRYRKEAERLLEHAMDQLAQVAMNASLFGGFAGVTWAVEHLQPFLFPDEDDLGEDIDALITSSLAQPHWAGHFDLVSGLAGMGLLGSERLRKGRASGITERVIERLEECARATPAGIGWWTPASWSPRIAERFPDGGFDMGLAHGQFAVLGFLAGTIHPRASFLIEQAFAWLLTHQQSANTASLFPSMVGSEKGVERSCRAGWCYGDPGIAVVSRRLANSLPGPSVTALADELCRRALARPMADCGVVDACICHGSSGLALIHARLFHYTGNPEHQDRALAWAQDTFARRNPEKGIAGFPFFSGLENSWEQPPGFLMGPAGVAASMMALSSAIEPAWDRALLLS